MRRQPILFTVSGSTEAQLFQVLEAPIPGTMWVKPNAGNTFTVEYSCDGGKTFLPVPGLNGASGYSEALLQSGIAVVRITPSGTQGGSWGVC